MPASLHHIGIAVPDLDAAIAWYSDVLGYSLIAGPRELDITHDRNGRMHDILGPIAKRLRVAHLSTGGGPGIELFATIDPPYERRNVDVEFYRSGPFHICVTHPDVAELAERIASTGGRQLSRIWYARPPSEEFTMAYCQDPFGTVIEVHSHPYEVVNAQAYKPA